MAFTGYLKIEGIDGESKRADHEGEIDCYGVEFSASQMSSSSVGSGRTRGRATLSDFTFHKWMDASSPYLMLACSKGKSFSEIVFTVRKDSGDAHLDYLIITLTNCIISGYKMAQNAPEAGSSEMVSESIEISYEKLNFKYVVQSDDHSKGDEHEVEYDLVAAK
ncbi:MAG: type VI secretion system tube protein Hcp [Rhodobacter sp.]|jgi:type VI secretion system secreted protein Hcp|nr:type VI secretion system tube protein Hcp [Rhodobacter sp.]MBK8440222.1 type VI secretion system tube protein Hcp [Rhodobacter sp.]